ncbi:MAG: DUF262 domain-containing protein [Candidatus Poribacteria bacterium]|nr:DUF262 domain-containing protein [Candidatus Poribacteria bacterium]
MYTDQKGANVNELFSVDVQYQVPRYQRRYVWDTINWRTLWEDILSQLSQELVEDRRGEFSVKPREVSPDSNFEHKDRGHFTGTIVTRPIKNGGQLERLEIIDGQQRLTTFQIILCVIRDICQSKNYDPWVREATRHIMNEETVIEINMQEGLPNPTYKFFPTDYDRSAFEAVAEGKYGELGSKAFEKYKEVSQRILEAYNYFKKMITIYVGKDCDYDRMVALIGSIKNNFQLIQIKLDPSDQPEKIFESLNATGRMLSEFDYLRNNLFLRAGSQRDKLYKEYWHFENQSHYWGADKLEAFLQVFLMAKLGPYCFQKDGNERKAFELYQKQYYRELKAKGGKIEDEFAQLSLYATSYKDMENDRQSKIGRRMQFYDDLEITSLQSFILYLRNEEKIDDNKLHTVFDILESYIVRYMIYTAAQRMSARSEYGEDRYARIDSFFSEVIEGHISFSISEFVKYLSSDSNLQGKSWPTEGQIKSRLEKLEFQILHTPWSSYRGKTSRFGKTLTVRAGKDFLLFPLRYMFYRIELLKRESLDPTGEVTLSFVEFSRIAKVAERIIHLRYLNYSDSPWVSIGNLTFRSGVTNGRLDRLPFEEKKELLLEANSGQFVINQEICKHSSWNQVKIGKRKKQLLDCFFHIFPSPDHFTQRVGERSSKSEVRLQQELRTQRTGQQSVPTIRSKVSEPFIAITYSGEKKLPSVASPDILFACSEIAWDVLEGYIENRQDIEEKLLGPIKSEKERLKIPDSILSTAQTKEISTTAVTRAGHELYGTIVSFDQDLIEMQISGQTVIVYKHGLLEFGTTEFHQGKVTKFNQNKGDGFIASGEYSSIPLSLSAIIGEDIVSLEGQNVEFEIYQTLDGLEARNVVPIN